MIRVCLIGVSGFAGVHYQTLLREHAVGRAALVGATVINQDEEEGKCAALRALGCPLFDDYRTMLQLLSGKAQLCVIPCGIHWHQAMTVAALEAGMHVLVEKPAAGSIQDVRAMQVAADKARKSVAVAYQHLYAPGTIEAKRAILSGRIGEVKSIKCRALWPRDSQYYQRNNWAGRLRVGDNWVFDSPANNALAHELMMMLFLAGASERRAAVPCFVEAEMYCANIIESMDTVCLRVRTATDITILFYASHACENVLDPEILVSGTRGRIISRRTGMVIEPVSGTQLEASTITSGDDREHMMRAVFDMVHGEDAFVCDLDMAAMQTVVVNAAHQACTIRPVESQSLRGENGVEMFAIPGIDNVVEKACNEEKLFHDLGVRWASPAGSLDCTNYREFVHE